MGRIGSLLRLFGVDLKKTGNSFRGLPVFFRNRAEMNRQIAAATPRDFPLGKLYPCLTDRFEPGGHPGGVYFHMDLWAAQRVYANRPERHVDVGSAVGGFCAHVATFMPIEIIDIRPTRSTARNMAFRTVDLMSLPDDLVASTPSLSCLHALEHFGLGRYGDPVDYAGHRKGFDNLLRMLTPGGKLYFAVPIGERQRIEFDAHRVFSLPYILNEMVADRLHVDQFAYIDDEGEIHPDADPRGADAQRTFGLKWGCGVLEMTKR